MAHLKVKAKTILRVVKGYWINLGARISGTKVARIECCPTTMVSQGDDICYKGDDVELACKTYNDLE